MFLCSQYPNGEIEGRFKAIQVVNGSTTQNLALQNLAANSLLQNVTPLTVKLGRFVNFMRDDLFNPQVRSWIPCFSFPSSSEVIKPNQILIIKVMLYFPLFSFSAYHQRTCWMIPSKINVSTASTIKLTITSLLLMTTLKTSKAT